LKFCFKGSFFFIVLSYYIVPDISSGFFTKDLTFFISKLYIVPDIYSANYLDI